METCALLGQQHDAGRESSRRLIRDGNKVATQTLSFAVAAFRRQFPMATVDGGSGAMRKPGVAVRPGRPLWGPPQHVGRQRLHALPGGRLSRSSVIETSVQGATGYFQMAADLDPAKRYKALLLGPCL